jgi:hypothetical protein
MSTSDRDTLLAAASILHRRYTPATWYSWGLRVDRPPRRIKKVISLLTREAWSEKETVTTT